MRHPVFVCGALLAVSALAQEPGFQPLFDGKTLNGWTQAAGKGRYVVQDGMIVCPGDGNPVLYTEKEYSDFILRFEFLMAPGGNNGIGIRCPVPGWASKDGIEIQILDAQPRKR